MIYDPKAVDQRSLSFVRHSFRHVIYRDWLAGKETLHLWQHNERAGYASGFYFEALVLMIFMILQLGRFVPRRSTKVSDDSQRGR